MEKNILINGAGTVGARVADLYLGMGFNIDLVKYGLEIRDGSPLINKRTAELMSVLKRYPNRDVKLFAARGRSEDERIAVMKEAGLPCVGPISKANLDEYDLIVDASPKKIEQRNVQEIYSQHPDVPFVLNGGAKSNLVQGKIFAGIPGTVSSEANYVEGNAQVVSCNTHAVTTALSLLEKTLNGWTGSLVRDVAVTYFRRYADPGEEKSRPVGVDLEFTPYHLDEIETLLPSFKGIIRSRKLKAPTQYFHTLIIDVNFHGKTPPGVAEEYEDAIRSYPRSVLVERNGESKLSHEDTIEASELAMIKDGDIYLPVYMVDSHEYGISVGVLTPQRSIVALSHGDYALLRTGLEPDFESAFSRTNETARLNGFPVNHYKNSLAYNLADIERAKERYG